MSSELRHISATPAQGVLHELYRVPEGCNALLSSIEVCNLSNAGDDEIDIAVSKGEAGEVVLQDFVRRSGVLFAGAHDRALSGKTLGSCDAVFIQSATGQTSFSANIQEIKG